MIKYMKIMRFIIIFIVAIGVYFGTSWFILKCIDDAPGLVPNMEEASLASMLPELGEGVLPIDEDGPVILENNPIYEEGILYMPIAYVESHFHEDFYWDSAEQVLTYTTINDVIRMRTDELTYYINDEPLALQIPIRELVEGVPYMPLEFLKKFTHHNFVYNGSIGTLVVEDKSLEHEYVTVAPTENSYGIIRTWKDRRSLIVKKVAKGQRLTVIGEDTVWMEVMTGEGFTGYIKRSEISDRLTVAGVPKVREVYDYSTRPAFEGGLNLAWNYVDNVTANRNLDSKLDGVHGLDVISPTWFYIKNEDGDIINKADINYVRKAHEQGMEVWALFANQFSNREMTHAALSSTSSRENMIKEILALSALYEIDGINVDFESLSKETGVHFVQFIKELTPYLKQQGLTVSVDMYVPSAWTAHYGRAEVGEVVDYVMIMAYDEHWSTSPESGSVASIGFVEKGIVDTLKEVPAEKTVLGLPYYTRRWTETVEGGEVKVKSKAFGMDAGYEHMTENGVTFTWLDDIAQYYGEYEQDGKTYKMWLEEERSIEEKVKLMERYDLAGVAGWQIGLEKDAVWDVLEDYLD